MKLCNIDFRDFLLCRQKFSGHRFSFFNVFNDINLDLNFAHADIKSPPIYYCMFEHLRLENKSRISCKINCSMAEAFFFDL